MEVADEGEKVGIKPTALSCCKVSPAICNSTACSREPWQILWTRQVSFHKLKIGKLGGLSFNDGTAVGCLPKSSNPETFRNSFRFCPFQRREEEGDL